MNTRNKLIATAALSALLSGAVLAANMTKQQIENAALKAQPGTVQQAKLEKMGGKELWRVQVKGTDQKEHYLYFTRAGEQVDYSGKPIKKQ
jgi:uncharacterized membrane protein YkoI